MLEGLALKPRPAAIANKARKARAATIQGRALVVGCAAGALAADAGVPQRWQNFAPGLRGEEHEAQLAPESGVPQLAQ